MWSACYSCQISIKFVFSRQIVEKSWISNFMKIRPVGAELFRADGRTDGRTDRQTDMTELTAAFDNYTNAPKNVQNNLRRGVRTHCFYISRLLYLDVSR
jgi:hypothetical protein